MTGPECDSTIPRAAAAVKPSGTSTSCPPTHLHKTGLLHSGATDGKAKTGTRKLHTKCS